MNFWIQLFAQTTIFILLAMATINELKSNCTVSELLSLAFFWSFMLAAGSFSLYVNWITKLCE